MQSRLNHGEVSSQPPTEPFLIPRLRCCGLRVFDSDPGDAMAVHFFYCEALAAVIACVADSRNLLQFRKHEAGEGFKTGVSRQQQVVLRFQISQPDGALEDERLALAYLHGFGGNDVVLVFNLAY